MGLLQRRQWRRTAAALVAVAGSADTDARGAAPLMVGPIPDLDSMKWYRSHFRVYEVRF